MKKLAGKIILITGAAGGIGSIAAKAIASAGAQGILLDKNIPKLEKLHDEIISLGHIQPALYPLDLSKANEIDYKQLNEVLNKNFGHVHGLMHCAAELGYLGPLVDTSESSWDLVLKTNLTAAHTLTKALLPLLKYSGDGRIIFTTDSSANRATAYWNIYGISKIALEAMSKIWKQELESEGLVQSILFTPGPVCSPIRKKTHPAENSEQAISPETLEKQIISFF